MISLDQIALSVFISVMGLLVTKITKSAPPRLVLYLCLVSMFAIVVPWMSVGQYVAEILPANFSLGAGVIVPRDLSKTSETLSSAEYGTLRDWVTGLVFAIGLFWLFATLIRSMRTTRKYHLRAIRDDGLAAYADPVFARALRRTRIYRLPNTSAVSTSGVMQPTIWIGDGVQTDAHTSAALNHELSHIAYNDQLTLYLIVIIERLLWWNPFIWLLGREARRQMEYACDARCQSLIGTTNYRRALAELFLQQQRDSNPLIISFGNGSDLINRMEKIAMTHALNAKHVLTLAGAGALITIASTALSAQEVSENPTLIQCHKLLPKDAKYDLSITSNIDTREGQSGEMTVTLTDPSNPDSEELPEGAGAFVQCLQKVVGVGDNEGWPKE